jgi:hypothetical protein
VRSNALNSKIDTPVNLIQATCGKGKVGSIRLIEKQEIQPHQCFSVNCFPSASLPFVNGRVQGKLTYN